MGAEKGPKIEPVFDVDKTRRGGKVAIQSGQWQGVDNRPILVEIVTKAMMDSISARSFPNPALASQPSAAPMPATFVRMIRVESIAAETSLVLGILGFREATDALAGHVKAIIGPSAGWVRARH